MTKAKFLVVYCLFISGLCCMANVTKDINMRFKDVRQGLSHQTVNCFYQDEFGFLWIGTQDGLNRFDGRKFEVFKPDNANPYSININNIRQVCGNKAGLLFIRSLQSVTLYDMRLNRFRVLREGEVAGICYAHDALWIATGKEIYRYRNLDQAPELFFSFPSDEEDVLMNGIVKENPTFVLLLGMCPTLGTTSSAINGMGMGLATMFVLICSNVVISAIKNLIPDMVRIPSFIVVIASFVTLLQMVMQAYVPALYATLGLFIPLIVVNCIVLGRAEAFAAKNNPVASFFDGLGMGLGFTIALTLLGAVREFLGTGKIFNLTILPEEYGMLVFVLAPGAFIALGYLIALVNSFKKA